MQNKKNENSKTPNKFVALMKAVFVHNIGWKILSVVSAAVLWALAVGLPGLA